MSSNPQEILDSRREALRSGMGTSEYEVAQEGGRKLDLFAVLAIVSTIAASVAQSFGADTTVAIVASGVVSCVAIVSRLLVSAKYGEQRKDLKKSAVYRSQ